ncbi:MAG: cell division protein FtsZ [Chloroflexi bacterium]|jgi:cell division protein FtsZ|nr:cell division protein FtsZ [Chloroflexota bacterium]
MDKLTRLNTDHRVSIKVVGVGGGGCNAVDRMVQSGLEGVELLAMNTDVQTLEQSLAANKLPLGPSVTNGRGAGGDPGLGQKAGEESYEQIKDALKGAEMVFITAGMGGGTGTGAAPVVAAAAMELGALTVAIVTTPFGFEGARKMTLAREGLQHLAQKSDTHIVVPNQRLLEILPRNVGFKDAFSKADEVLHQGVEGVTRLVTGAGIINVDFNDVSAIMRGGGRALMAIGRGSGETRAIDAAMSAIDNPLLEASIDGASRVLMHIKGGADMSLHEVTEAANVIHERMDGEANVIWGAATQDEMDGNMELILIATAFSERGDGRPVPTRTSASSQLAKGKFDLGALGLTPEDVRPSARPRR